jgi:hypothetical protein
LTKTSGQNYESGGQEFESLRARHLVFICEHPPWVARTAFSRSSLLPAHDVIINFDDVDECLKVSLAGGH